MMTSTSTCDTKKLTQQQCSSQGLAVYSHVTGTTDKASSPSASLKMCKAALKQANQKLYKTVKSQEKLYKSMMA